MIKMIIHFGLEAMSDASRYAIHRINIHEAYGNKVTIWFNLHMFYIMLNKCINSWPMFFFQPRDVYFIFKQICEFDGFNIIIYMLGLSNAILV